MQLAYLHHSMHDNIPSSYTMRLIGELKSPMNSFTSSNVLRILDFINSDKDYKLALSSIKPTLFDMLCRSIRKVKPEFPNFKIIDFVYDKQICFRIIQKNSSNYMLIVDLEKDSHHSSCNIL